MAGGIIKYRCARCGTVLESTAQHAGKQDTCPECKMTIPVPMSSTVGLGAFIRQHLILSYSLAAACIVAGIAMVVLLVGDGKDTWEQSNGETVLELSKAVVSLVDAGDYENAIVQFDRLNTLIADRELNDVELSRAQSDAGKAIDDARQVRSRDSEVLQQIELLQTQASSEAQNGNYRQAGESIRHARDLLRTVSKSNPAATDMENRLAGIQQHVLNLQEEQRRQRAEQEKLKLEAQLAAQHAEAQRMKERLAAIELAEKEKERIKQEEEDADPAKSFEKFARSLVDTVNKRKHSHTYTVGQTNRDGSSSKATYTRSIRLTEMAFDVRRTDSLVNPVVGILQVRNIDFGPRSRAEYRLNFTRDKGTWVMSGIEWRLDNSRWYHESHNIPPYALPILYDALENMP